MYPASQTQQSVPGHRRQPHDGPLRVLVGKERFSEDHPWSEMPEHRQHGRGEPDGNRRRVRRRDHVVLLASHGLTNRELADRVFLSPRTVSSHLYRSFPKLGVADRHQLSDVIAGSSLPSGDPR
ncbi:MAG TPA: helix-turn-helix transcriptional regulator [Trebonia sp.]